MNSKLAQEYLRTREPKKREEVTRPREDWRDSSKALDSWVRPKVKHEKTKREPEVAEPKVAEPTPKPKPEPGINSPLQETKPSPPTLPPSPSPEPPPLPASKKRPKGERRTWKETTWVKSRGHVVMSFSVSREEREIIRAFIRDKDDNFSEWLRKIVFTHMGYRVPKR